MNKQDIEMLFKYDAWSNAKIIEQALRATNEQFLALVPFPHGSLRGTLVHAIFAEWLWCNRWEGTPRSPAWKSEDYPAFADLRRRWVEVDERLMRFVQNVTDQRLQGTFQYVSTEGFPHERVLWEAMAHLVNHGTQHKTEAAAILTGFGCSPGDIDLIVYLNERKSY